MRLARVARRLGFQCDTSYVVLFSLVDAASRDTCEVHRVHAHFTVTQCDSFIVSRELCLIYWRRQPWGTGARAPLDLQQFIFFRFTLELSPVGLQSITTISRVK